MLNKAQISCCVACLISSISISKSRVCTKCINGKSVRGCVPWDCSNSERIRLGGSKAAKINNNMKINACTSMRHCSTINVIVNVDGSTSCLRHLGVFWQSKKWIWCLIRWNITAVVHVTERHGWCSMWEVPSLASCYLRFGGGEVLSLASCYEKKMMRFFSCCCGTSVKNCDDESSVA